VLALKLYLIVTGFDTGAVLQNTTSKIISKVILLILCINLYFFYDYITKLSITTEKCLIINIIRLRQSYKRQEINKICWINGKDNLANVITKDKLCLILKQLINSN
jgi:hypothetical protein